MPRLRFLPLLDEHLRLLDVLYGREMRKQIELLKHHADVFPHLVQVFLTRGLHIGTYPFVPQVVAIHGHEAAVDRLQGHENSENGGLSRTTGADQCKSFTIADLQ